jgi:hypothetical protein
MSHEFAAQSLKSPAILVIGEAMAERAAQLAIQAVNAEDSVAAPKRVLA